MKLKPINFSHAAGEVHPALQLPRNEAERRASECTQALLGASRGYGLADVLYATCELMAATMCFSRETKTEAKDLARRLLPATVEAMIEVRFSQAADAKEASGKDGADVPELPPG